MTYEEHVAWAIDRVLDRPHEVKEQVEDLQVLIDGVERALMDPVGSNASRRVAALFIIRDFKRGRTS